jgi:hypothetical protein
MRVSVFVSALLAAVAAAATIPTELDARVAVPETLAKRCKCVRLTTSSQPSIFIVSDFSLLAGL